MNTKETARSAIRLYRFGPYELDLRGNELRKFGLRLKLERKPLKLLCTLLDHAGEVVTRSELQEYLWGQGVFVDFDKGLNVAVTKLRAALNNDASETQKYIETVAGEGYRFSAAVQQVLSSPECAPTAMPPNGTASPQTGVSLPVAQEHLPVSGDSAGSPVNSASRTAYGLLAAAIVIAVAVFGFTVYRQLGQKKLTAHLTGQDWVLVTQFDNRADQVVLDDIASFALKVELSDSQQVRLVAPERVQEILRLMKKPPGTRIDAAVGREICLRDGGINVLITGRVEKLGPHYLLSVLLVDPVTDVPVKGFSEEASDETAVLATVRRLSNRVRENLGEALPLVHRETQRLAPVTTSSLHALELYSKAAGSEDDSQTEQLLRAAVDQDPQFASAYIELAAALINHGKRQDEWLPAARFALELADNLPERERYFIRGSYDQMIGHPAEAVSAYESLLQLDPHHLEALQHLYELTRRKELLYRLADIHADSFEWNRRAWTKSNAEGDVSAEQRFAMRAQQLATPANLESGPEPAEAAVKLAGAYRYLQRGELRLAQADAERASADLDVLGPRGKNSLAIAEGNFYFFLGKLQQADGWYARADPVSKRFYSAMLAEARGARFSPSLVRIWDQDATFCLFDPELAVKLASAGDFRWAEKLAGPQEVAIDIVRAGLSDYSSLSKGTIQLYRGNVNNAITLLKRANADLRAGPSIDVRIVGTRLIAAETLASALERNGEIRAAADVLQPFEADPVFDPEDVLGSPAEAQFHLARLYRKLGRIREAKRIESQLRVLFAESDRDYQLARLLHRSSPGQ